MENNTYTKEQIRRAFWETFYQAGEIYFSCSGDDEMDNRSVESEWDDFIYKLKKQNNEIA